MVAQTCKPLKAVLTITSFHVSYPVIEMVARDIQEVHQWDYIELNSNVMGIL
jgi:hypothetical protein